MYADTGIDEDGFGRAKIVEKAAMRVKTCAEVPVWGDEVVEEDVFAITEETWRTGGAMEKKEVGRLKRWRKMGFQ